MYIHVQDEEPFQWHMCRLWSLIGLSEQLYSVLTTGKFLGSKAKGAYNIHSSEPPLKWASSSYQ